MNTLKRAFWIGGFFIFLIKPSYTHSVYCCYESEESIDSGTGRLLNLNPRTGLAKSLGETRMAAIMIKFQDDVENHGWIDGKIATPRLCRSLLFDAQTSVNAFVREASYDKTWLSGDVFGPYVVPVNAPTDPEDPACTPFDEVIKIANPDIDYFQYDVGRTIGQTNQA